MRTWDVGKQPISILSSYNQKSQISKRMQIPSVSTMNDSQLSLSSKKGGISQINPKLNWKIRYSVINHVQRKSPSAIKGKKEETPKHVWVRSTIYNYFYQKSLILLARPLIASTCRPSSSPEQHRTMFLSWAAVREGTTAEWGYTHVCRLQQNLVSLGFQRVSKDRINRITFFICKEKKHAHRNFRQTFNMKSNTLTESQQLNHWTQEEPSRNVTQTAAD